MRENRTQKMVTIAILAAISYLLMLIYFPLIPAFSYMTIDFSEIPILIGAFLLGPGAGVGIAFLRSVLHFITTGASVATFIGDTASFLAAMSYIMPIYFISRRKNSKRSLYVGLVVGVLNLTLIMSIANYFVITPLYMKVLGFNVGMPIMKYILIGVIPFNLLKGTIVSLLFIAVHNKLLPWLTTKMSHPIQQ